MQFHLRGSDRGAMKQVPETWLAAALSGDASPDLREFPPAEVWRAAEEHDVLPLLDWHLQKCPAWIGFPESFRSALKRHARAEAAQGLFRLHELRRVSARLEREGIRALLLKGTALGQWLYPQPYLRVSGDIDLLFADRGEADRAAGALSSLGYALQFSPASTNYAMTSRLVVDGASRSELDLHCRLLNAAAYAETFSFEELWKFSQPLPNLGIGLRGLSLLHALAHACLNRGLDMQLGVPDRLKLLYDIHLMVRRMDAAAWDDFLEIATDKGICGPCLRSIQDAASRLGSSVPDGSLVALRHHAEREAVDWRRLHDWRYMQRHNLRSLPTWQARVSWVWDRVFPTTSHLRELYGNGSWAGLMRTRILRAVGRLRR